MTSSYMTSGRPQVLVDEQQLQNLQAEAARRGVELDRLKNAMETLTAVNTPSHFMAAAMALCNELASRWNAERAGLGFLKGRYVRLRALSHTEKITRNMQLVQDVEGAMEECLDQDVEIIVPPPKDASFVYRMTEGLAARHGPNTVASFPLRRPLPPGEPKRTEERYGDVVAVLTIERKAEKPFTLAEIETLRLTADLFTSRLVDLYEHDRWIGAKAFRGTRRGLAWVVGAKHTWAKLIAAAVAAFLGFAFFVNGTFKAEAPFSFEASEKQVVAAPYDGILKTVNVKIGDMVYTPKTAEPLDELNSISPIPVLRVPHPQTVLVTLRTEEYIPRLAQSQAEYDQHLQEANIYGKDGKEAERQMSLFQAAKSKGEIDFYQLEIARATINSPIDGVVFSGDLTTKVGAPVKTGDELFQIGQPENLRAELSIPEDEISEVKVGQRGILKATSYPDRPIHFTVERINPIAVVTGTKNVFKVRVQIDSSDLGVWMRPGMEGLAKVDIGPARYAWIWTHRLINWVRMKLWM